MRELSPRCACSHTAPSIGGLGVLSSDVTIDKETNLANNEEGREHDVDKLEINPQKTAFVQNDAFQRFREELTLRALCYTDRWP
eukprot:140960-Prymnesium_polylepis.1